MGARNQPTSQNKSNKYKIHVRDDARMKFFLAGIMQGSLESEELHNQVYRQHLRELLQRRYPDAEIFDPFADHQDSVRYDDATGREVFYQHNRLCREVDVVVAFVPEASMGTAIEMWEAHEHGRGVVVSISPLTYNWAVRFCSHVVFVDLASFKEAVENGELDVALRQALEAKKRQ